VCFNAASRICDSASIEDAEAFAMKIFLEIVFRKEGSGLPEVGVGCTGEGEGWY